MLGSILGHPVRRVEDPDLLTGASRYVGDLAADDCLYAAFVRSTVAHGRLGQIETGEAGSMPGVAGVFTAGDFDLEPLAPGMVPEAFARPVVASDVVRFVGEIVAVVVADSAARAMDAAETILVDVEPLSAVIDLLSAGDDDAPILFPEHGTNRAMDSRFGDPDPLAGAEVVAE